MDAGPSIPLLEGGRSGPRAPGVRVPGTTSAGRSAVRIPDQVRRQLRERLWARADEIGWQGLTWVEKSPLYEAWTKDPEIGGHLSRYLDQRRIRVYIKDTIMKGYIRIRQADPTLPLRALGIDDQVAMAESFERPHGRRLQDGRVVAWGNADDWKLVITALHERSYGVKGAHPYAAVLFSAVGKFHQQPAREMVGDAVRKLGIERLLWIP